MGDDAARPRGRRSARAGSSWSAGELGRGFRLPAAGLTVWSERQLLRRSPLVRREQGKSRKKLQAFLGGLRDLKVGDYVVHTEHGIGQFVQLRTLGSGPAAAGPAARAAEGDAARRTADVEVMEIAYSGGKRLLLPLSRLDQIQKFSGIEGIAPRLDQLGGSSWNRTKSAHQEGPARHGGRADPALRRAPDGPGAADDRQLRAREPVRRLLRVRRNRRPARGHRRDLRGHGAEPADGPPALRRRRFRQNRGGDAGRLAGGRQRLPGGGAGADHHPGRPASRDLPPPFRRPAGPDRDDLPLPHPGRGQGDRRQGRGRRHRHPDRHPSPAWPRRSAGSGSAW